MERNLSDIRLLQAAEMMAISNTVVGMMQGVHFKIVNTLDKSDAEIELMLKELQPLFLFLQNSLNIKEENESAIIDVRGSSKSVLDFYENKPSSNANKLIKLYTDQGSQLEKFIYIKKA